MKPTYEDLEKRIKLLEERQEDYRLTLEALPVGVVVHAADTNIIFANSEAGRTLGLTQNQILGKKNIDPAWQFIHEDMRIMDVEDYPVSIVASTQKKLHDYVVGIKQKYFDKAHITWVIVNAIPLFNSEGELDRIIVNFVDITPLKKSENKLKDAEELFRTFMDYIPAVVFIKDIDSRTLFINRCFKETFGLDDNCLGKNPIEIFGNTEVARQMIEDDQKVFESGFIQKEEYLMTTKGEKCFDTMKFVVGKRKRFLGGVAYDVTEAKNLKLNQQHRQKMEAVGTLAGGIAHDFNNVLSIILGNAELASLDLSADNSAKGNVEEIVKASLRAKNVVAQLLSFSRNSAEKMLPIKLSHVVSESVKFLRASIPSNIEIQVDIPEKKEGTIIANHTQMGQIIINLCTNSAHAMEEGGVLTVGIQERIFEEEVFYNHGVLMSGTYIQLEIKDEGYGIPPDVMDKIFDPYFTTKAINKGTGLGLSVVHGIVEHHHGAIAVESEVGQGTSIKIFLPESTAEAKDEKIDLKITLEGNEKILFVDDEEMVLTTAALLLESFGYKVKKKGDPLEALSLFKLDPSFFDLIVTDMSMPHLNGVQLAQEVKKIRHDIPIILCTGYNESIDQYNATEMGIDHYLEKPLTREDLGRAVRVLLNKKAGRT